MAHGNQCILEYLGHMTKMASVFENMCQNVLWTVGPLYLSSIYLVIVIIH